MKTLSDYREQKLPPSPSQNDTDEYKNVQIDRTASEFDEPLVDLAGYGIRTDPFYSRTDGLNQPVGRPFPFSLTHVYARRSVAHKLTEVNKLLRPYGMQVVVLDGFRTIAVQEALWTWMLERGRKLLPLASQNELTAFALRYATDPSTFKIEDAATWPTHATGGAVDLTLEETATGKPAYMGGIYLDSSMVSSIRYYEDAGLSESASHREALRNRRLLFWCMTEAGFVNYAFEWWHFDYLTQASIMNLGMPPGLKAHYGLANAGMAPAAEREGSGAK
ncbi:MAG TPA: M15 family metallopeptidase [Planktothrix sp.]|jgi:D-alanyl-D-alanine dipeptidase